MLRAILVGWACVYGLAACAHPISLERRFYQTAFYDEETGREQTLVRHDENMRIAINGGTDRDRIKIRALGNQIAEATGLDVSLVSPLDSPTVNVTFLTEKAWQAIKEEKRRKRASRGLSNYGYEPVCSIHTFDLDDGGVVISVLIPDRLSQPDRDACLAQEIGHTTGLMNDVVGAYDSAFGDWAGASELTAVDYQLLRILYDPRLRSGMTWAEARPIVREIISEMEAGR